MIHEHTLEPFLSRRWRWAVSLCLAIELLTVDESR
jgi:hypothetical protein